MPGPKDYVAVRAFLPTDRRAFSIGPRFCVLGLCCTCRKEFVMFLFFNNRIGCLSSLVISAIVTFALLAITGLLHFH